jgi:ADP-ribose pyrophosphatase
VTHAWEVLGSLEQFAGRIWSVRSDRVRMPGGGDAVRDVVVHPGAVGAVAVDLGENPAGRVLLVRQYRHPVGAELWELPAGLLDVAGEKALVTAQRELREEADLVAGTWHVLADVRTSPGFTDEAIRLFLARDLTVAPEEFDRYDEEAVMTTRWFDLDEAAAMVLSGAITNAMCCIGVLAAARVRDAGWTPLRPADSPWEARPDRA